MKLILTSALLLVTSCTTVPRAELGGYIDSFHAAQAAATPIIAEYGVAERKARLDRLHRTGDRFARGYFDTFEISDAPEVTTVGLPPNTEATDRALRSVGAYSDTLVYLAENKNIDEAKAQLKSIAGNIGGLPGVELPLGALVDGLATAVAPAIEARNRKEFRSLVLRGHDPALKVIDGIRSLTPVQYEAITKSLRLRETDAPPEARQEIRDKINKWHAVFADYVVLLDAMEARLNDLYEVALHPPREPLLVRADRGAAELRSYADSLQRSIAQLHADQ
jgi:hypothetical protein